VSAVRLCPYRDVNKFFRFEAHLDTYLGCEHNCVYCGAREVHDVPPSTWVKVSKLDVDYVKLSEKRVPLIGRLRRIKEFETPSKAICLGDFSDPYQPLERELKHTRSVIERLSAMGYRAIVRTKSDLVTRDLDVFPKNWVLGVSVSYEPGYAEAKRWEPNAPSAERRIEAVKAFADAGIPVELWLQPVLPGSNPFKVIDLLEDYVVGVRVECLYKTEYVVKEAPTYDGLVFKRYAYPEYADWYASLAPKLIEKLMRTKLPYQFDNYYTQLIIERKAIPEWWK